MPYFLFQKISRKRVIIYGNTTLHNLLKKRVRPDFSRSSVYRSMDLIRVAALLAVSAPGMSTSMPTERRFIGKKQIGDFITRGKKI